MSITDEYTSYSRRLMATFGNVLDGLIMVDLTGTDPKLLNRYMESDGLATFMAYHRQDSPDLLPTANISYAENDWNLYKQFPDWQRWQ